MELISKKGYDNLYKEYSEIDKKIIEAQREMGESVKRDNDLRENPEFMELRVKAMYTLPAEKKKLFERVHNCMLIEETEDFKKFDGTTVIPGSKVNYQIDDEEESITILGDNESNLEEEIISSSAPFAKAIIGKHIKDIIEFNNMKIIINSIEKI